MKRILPRTVVGQVIAVALLALAISQFALLAIMIQERQSAIRNWWTTDILSRIASVVELLDETPDPLHEKVLFASDTPILNLSITPEGPDAQKPDVQTPDAQKPDVQKPDAQKGEMQVPSETIAEGEIYLRELRLMTGKDPKQLVVEIGLPPTWSDILQQWIATWRDQPIADTDPWLEASVQLKNGQWLNMEVARRLQAPSLALLLIPVVTMLLVFGSAIVMVMRHITRPIKRLAEAAEAFGRGEEVPPVPVQGPQEIAQAIDAFNDMRERLTRFVLDRTKMLASVGHDLRTPITSMRLRAEFIEDEETRDRILASLEEMQHMAEAALGFAREEASAEPTRIVDLNALVQTVCTDQADMHRDVEYQETERVLYRCRPHSLIRAVRNLVENAVIHGGRARVALNGPANQIWITVDDDGPGIREEDMSRVFAPFVRLDESRGEETGGIGLGLAIARSIVRGHGGDIALQNRERGGLSATIQLPNNS
jgi:signal transduction histidine kinase